MTQAEAKKEADRLIAAARLGAHILVMHDAGLNPKAGRNDVTLYDRFVYDKEKGYWLETSSYPVKEKLYEIKDQLVKILTTHKSWFSIKLDLTTKFNGELADIIEE